MMLRSYAWRVSNTVSGLYMVWSMMVWHVMRSMMRVAPLMRRAVSRRIRGTVRGLVWGVVALGVMAGPWGAAWDVANGAPERQTTTVDTSRFGIVEAYYRPDEARELGVGWERIVFDWARFQPEGPDQFEMEAVPVAHLEAARSAGREVVGLLKNVPNWASGAPETVMGEPPEGLDRPLDDPGNAWAAFVMRVVETYSEEWDIHHWIIFNEPDIRPGELPWHEFDGTVEDYYQLLKVGYLAAKLVDPDAVIHVGGMAWWGDVTQGRPMYLKRLLDVAARDPEAYDHDFFFDAVSLHVYFDTQNVWEMVTQTRGILTHYRQEGKPIWINEINARPAFDPRADVPPAMYDVSLGQQADFMVQAAALALAAGVERFAV